MCCSGSRFSRRPMSTQKVASKSPSGTVCSSPRFTLCTCAAMISASARGESTPASASRAVASAISSSSSDKLLLQLGFQVGGRQGVDHAVQVTVDHLVKVVRLVTHPVIGNAVLREVIGTHSFGTVHRADLGLALGARLGVGLRLGGGQQPAAQHPQRLLLVLELTLLVL